MQKEDKFLNMIMEFIPETLWSVAQCDGTNKPLLEAIYVKVTLHLLLQHLCWGIFTFIPIQWGLYSASTGGVLVTYRNCVRVDASSNPTHAAAEKMKKRSERRKHCTGAGCSKVRTPPARCHKPTDRTDYNILRCS